MNLRSLSVFTPIILFFLLSTSCKKSTILPEKVPSVSINPSSLNIAKSEAYSYGLTVNVDGVSLDPVNVKWSSNNPKVATVSDMGYVKGVGGGETDIIATLINGQGVVKCKVTVNDEYAYKFRIILKDKGTSGFAINAPEKFLSAKAIERRKKRNIAVDETDLPISPDYIKEIQKVGGVIVAKSKWLNTVSVHCDDGFLIDEYRKLPFVKDVVTVWQGKKAPQPSQTYMDQPVFKTGSVSSVATKDSLYYGSAWTNIKVNNGQAVHSKGFDGAGIDIAVIDAGFNGLKTNPSLSNMSIKGAKSFIYEDANPYATDSHGIWVTSCMATDKPGYFVGTAPAANYWLLRSEDESSEYAIEEDYWVAAIEFADSAGVDVVNTSLSYKDFTGLSATYHKYEEMDGKTALASRGANMAANKGIFIVCCAGNEQSWVGTPSDSQFVLTVGAINTLGNIDTFTNFGITVDGRIKPDVVALGGGASVIDIDGKFMIRSGTSYASPIICGLAACLWQAYPKLTNKDLLDVIKRSSSKYDMPLIQYGYGVPNMQKAMQLAQIVSASK